jgi:SAM-dependent methyltransferase
MRRRPQLIPWKSAGQLTERQASGDDVVRATGWVFNNETGQDLTLAEFVATGDQEVPPYLTVFGLRPDAESVAAGATPTERQTLVEIGCGIGRMTCAFTREYGTVIACDLDPGFLERCHETVARFGKIDRLRTSRVVDGATLDLPPNTADVAFSYITLQHCDADDALGLTSEAVRVTRPGGRIVLNYRRKMGMDWLLLPLGSLMRSMFRIPRFGPWLAGRRLPARFGWQANRLAPSEVIGPLGVRLRDVELWHNPKVQLSLPGVSSHTFEGINPHHYWVIATVR